MFSINHGILREIEQKILSLHSTMFSINRLSPPQYSIFISSLHSTMFSINRDVNERILAEIDFTFHYVFY